MNNYGNLFKMKFIFCNFASGNQPFFKPKDYEKVKFKSSSYSARR